MLAVNELSVQFSGNYLFNKISFQVNPSDKIGLTGKNGAGKSTLLKIIAGIQPPESGNVSMPRDYTIGYLPQEMEHQSGSMVFDEAKKAFHTILSLQDKIHDMTMEMTSHPDTSSPDFMELLEKINDAQEKFSMLGGYQIDGETEKVLYGLGFNETDFTKAVETFSGGWRMRIELAKILLQKPDLLLLDEPTNHLDIESIQWLEQFLKNYPGAVVMVSHDKIFLDTITIRTIEISMGRIHDYKASYSRYLELREERKELLGAAYENQQQKIREMERFVERFKAKATKASQAQSRVKALERMERIELDEEDSSAMRFRFPEPPRSGKVVVETSHLVKKYGDKLVLDHIDLSIERGDRIAFVGKNGEGKSTMSKILAGVESYDGKIQWGHNVKIGYYAQTQADTLSGDKTLLETIDDAATGEMRTKVRSLLGAFLFSGDAVDKKVKVLSGGEKARMALALLLLQPVNLLIMDEPTNHLDMRSKDILKEALMAYSGALVVVSHDRDFLQGLTGKVYEFKNHKLKLHYGDVNSFLEARKLEDLNSLNANKNRQQPKKDPVQPMVPEKSAGNFHQLSREEQRQLENRKKKLTKLIEELEEKINIKEKELAAAEKALLEPGGFNQQQQMLNKYQTLDAELRKEMAVWEQNQEELEKLMRKL